MVSGIFVKIISIVLLLAVGIVLILGIGTAIKSTIDRIFTNIPESI